MRPGVDRPPAPAYPGAGDGNGAGARRPGRPSTPGIPPMNPRRLLPPAQGPAAPPAGARICEVIDGPALGTLRVWTESEWAALPEADRPAEHAHYPGLGW